MLNIAKFKAASSADANSCLGREGMTLLQVTPSCTAVRCIEKQLGNLKGEFEHFFPTRSSNSFNITQLDSAQLRELQRHNALISQSWVTDWLPSGFHLLPRLKERLR